MKKILSTLMMVLLIGLFAGLAGAQTDLHNGGDQTNVHNWADVPGVDGNGGTVRNGDEYFQEGEPHGPQDGDANKIFIDEDGDGFDDSYQLQVRMGGENRELQGDGQGDGDCVGEGTQTMNQTMAGEAQQHAWGPGGAGSGGHTGPIGDGGFGPGQSNGAGNSDSSAADGGENSARSRGRRK